MPIHRLCEFCNGPFQTTQYFLNKGQGRFCSQTCAQQGLKKPDDERYWSFVIKHPAPQCYEWSGAKNKTGYGQLMVNCKQVGAHRFAYELHHGTIPPGMVVCHHCDNPECTRISHLFLGTFSDNSVDSVKKGRAGAIKMTEDQVKEIRAFAGSMSFYALGRRYGISDETIRSIVHRKTWKHIL